ncbi:MAG: hypothetical protein PHV43_01245 [Candidatus Colwellbacteria bacterium]|nr:hypothetical protein [Candidatus Colwellbacteria bacterium]
MKFYIAARFGLKDEVRGIYKTLQEKGHEIVADWTEHKPIKPYEENKDLARDYSIEDVDAASNCDVFVLISSDAGTGMYVELGAAISNNIKSGKPKIYVVGDNTDRAMFYFHPSVTRKDTFEEVLKDLDI